MAVTVLRRVCSVGGHNIVNHVLQDDLEYPNHVTSEPYSAILFLPFPNLCLLFLFLTSLSISLSLWFFGFSLGFDWLFLFLMGRWGRTWRIRWSWFVADLMVLGLMISEFGFSLSFGEFRRLGCVDGAGQLWWIWVWWLDWVHCSSFFLLVFTLIFSSCFHLCSTDLGLSSWVAGFVFLWWVWVLGCWVWFGKNTKNML